MRYLVIFLITFLILIPKNTNNVSTSANNSNTKNEIRRIPISHTKVLKSVIIREDARIKLRIKSMRSITIKDVWIEPIYPEYDDNVTVYAIVENAEEVCLNWTTGNRFNYVKMNLVAPLENKYSAVIPAHSYDTIVYFRIEAFNYTSNESVKTNWFNFVFDDFTPPNITKIVFPNTTLTLNEILITLNASEDENASGLYLAYVIIQYSEDNKTWSNEYAYDMNYNSTGKYFYLKLSFTNHGYYRFYFIVEDYAGNQARSPKDSNKYYYIRVLPRIARIRILVNNTEADEIQIRYTDAIRIFAQALDLNGTYVINGEIEIKINNDVLGYVYTNETGFAEFYLLADKNVGKYNLTLTLHHSAYKVAKLIVNLKIIRERAKIIVSDVNSQTYNVSLKITVKTDDDERIPYGNLRVASGSRIIYDEHLTFLEDVKITMNVFDLKTFENETRWIALLTIEFYGNPNYENASKNITIEIRASRILATYDNKIKQGERLCILINASDPDYVRRIIVKIDNKEVENKTVAKKNIILNITHCLSINETVGEHNIMIIVRDMLGNEVSRVFKFIVIQAKIMMKVNITKLSNGVYINGMAKYDVNYNASLIKIIIEIRIENNRKFIEPNATYNNTLLLFNATIKFYGSALIRIIAYDEYDHRNEFETIISIPYRESESSQMTLMLIITTIILLIVGLGVKLKFKARKKAL